MLVNNTGKIVKMANINDIADKDNIDNDIFIFDDITDMSINDDPIKLMMPIFSVCIQGSARVMVNLKEYNITKNTLITLMPEHIIHGCEHSDDFKGLFIGVRPDYREETIPDIHALLPFVLSFKSTPIIKLSDSEVENLKEIYTFIWNRIKNPEGYYRKKIVNSMLQALLYETLNIYKARNNYKPTKRSRNEEIFYKFFSLVERDFKIDRSVAYYADKLCITPKHLSAVIKAVSGKTAGEWIDNYVVLAAKVMLRSSSHTIQEISAELNFANQSFFGKYFKQQVGMSPSEYRSKTI